MKLSQYFKKECCLMDLESKDKKSVVREMAKHLCDIKAVGNIEDFTQAVLEREELGSTGIGNGVAIPHARTKTVKGFVIGFGRSVEGVDFEAIDEQKVNLIFLMGADPSQLNLYLRLLAELSKMLMDHSFRKGLIEAATGEEVVNIIKDFENK